MRDRLTAGPMSWCEPPPLSASSRAECLSSWRGSVILPTLIVVLVVLSALVFAAPARAQSSVPARRTLTNDYGPYSVYGPGLTYRQPSFYSGPFPTSVRVQTSVLVPDGGEALVG